MRGWLFYIAAIYLSGCGGHDQDPESFSAAQLAALAPSPNPADVASPEALDRAIRDALSGPVGNWHANRLRSLILPNALFVYPSADDKGNKKLIEVSAEEFIQQAREFHKESSWYERGLVTKTIHYGDIAVVYSSGQAGKSRDGQPDERGINICEMINDGKRWWVISATWTDIGNAAWPQELDSAKQVGH